MSPATQVQSAGATPAPAAPGAPRRALRTPLRVAPAPLLGRSRAARAPFVLLLAALLGGALLTLLMINTALAQGAFVINDLDRRSDQLVDDQQALQQQLALASSPRQLAARAVSLGMVPSTNPAFLRLSDGKVLGKPEAGRRPLPSPLPAPAATPGATAAAAKPGTAKPGATPAAPKPGATPAAPKPGATPARKAR